MNYKDNDQSFMEVIALLAVLLIASSLFMIAYVVITNYYAAKKINKEQE